MKISTHVFLCLTALVACDVIIATHSMINGLVIVISGVGVAVIHERGA